MKYSLPVFFCFFLSAVAAASDIALINEQGTLFKSLPLVNRSGGTAAVSQQVFAEDGLVFAIVRADLVVVWDVRVPRIYVGKDEILLRCADGTAYTSIGMLNDAGRIVGQTLGFYAARPALWHKKNKETVSLGEYVFLIPEELRKATIGVGDYARGELEFQTVDGVVKKQVPEIRIKQVDVHESVSAMTYMGRNGFRSVLTNPQGMILKVDVQVGSKENPSASLVSSEMSLLLDGTVVPPLCVLLNGRFIDNYEYATGFAHATLLFAIGDGVDTGQIGYRGEAASLKFSIPSRLDFSSETVLATE